MASTMLEVIDVGPISEAVSSLFCPYLEGEASGVGVDVTLVPSRACCEDPRMESARDEDGVESGLGEY